MHQQMPEVARPLSASAGVCRWTSTMQTDIAHYAWKRRGFFHCTRTPVRERRPLGFLGPGAAIYRRFLKRSRHRRARRTMRASLRGCATTDSDP